MNQTILIVDDLASVRLYHFTLLKHRGFRCRMAANGSDALTLLHEGGIDLVVLDMIMPGMSGEVFALEIAKIPAFATLPLLVITSEEPIARAAFAGTSRSIGVLAKPVMPDALIRGVEALLPKTIPDIHPLNLRAQ